MARAYLTIDDSPSSRMDDLIDAFVEKEIPALFFCRGDLLEKNPIMALKAVERGFVLGNHAYSHERASNENYEDFVDQIEKTERLIDNVYSMAGIEKPGQYFRFPHLDRGCGSWIMDFEAFDVKQRTLVKSIFTEGLNVVSAKQPDDAAREKMQKLQEYLKEGGYSVPFKGVNIDWYKDKQVQAANDCLFTYSTADWMVTQRHLGKWRYQSLDDLKNKIDYDQRLVDKKSVSVVLAHDQAEIIDTTLALIDHMLDRKITFLPFA